MSAPREGKEFRGLTQRAQRKQESTEKREKARATRQGLKGSNPVYTARDREGLREIPGREGA